MLQDSKLIAFNEAAIAGAAGTDVSSTLYVGAGAGNAGGAYIDARMTVAAAGGTSLNLQLFTGNAADMSDEVLLMETGAVAEADMVANYKFALDMLPGGGKVKKYIRFKAVKVGVHTGGKLWASITSNKDC